MIITSLVLFLTLFINTLNFVQECTFILFGPMYMGNNECTPTLFVPYISLFPYIIIYRNQIVYSLTDKIAPLPLPGWRILEANSVCRNFHPNVGVGVISIETQ